MDKLGQMIKNKKLLNFIVITQRRMKEAEMGSSGVVVAYYLMLSLFPLIMAVGSILPYLKLDPSTVLPYIQELMPAEIYQQLEPAITSLLTQSSTGLVSFSALATLWAASKSVNALQGAMNKAYGVEARRNFFVAKLVSFMMMFLLIIALLGVMVVLGLGQEILNWLQSVFHFSLSIVDTFSALKWPVVIVGLLIVMCLIYRLLPNAQIRTRDVWPGALFTSCGWVLLSQVFGLYLSYFSPAMASYQIIGSFIVLMLWLNLASSIIILGGIINAVLAEYRSGTELKERKGILARIKKLVGKEEVDKKRIDD